MSDAGFPVRVMVAPAWNTIELRVAPQTTVRELKRRAMREAKIDPDSDEFVVKHRGAEVLDESLTLDGAGIVPNAHLIVLHARRQPVR